MRDVKPVFLMAASPSGFERLDILPDRDGQKKYGAAGSRRCVVHQQVRVRARVRRIVVQVQLLEVESLVTGLDAEYKKFLASDSD